MFCLREKTKVKARILHAVIKREKAEVTARILHFVLKRERKRRYEAEPSKLQDLLVF